MEKHKIKLIVNFDRKSGRKSETGSSILTFENAQDISNKSIRDKLIEEWRADWFTLKEIHQIK